MVMDIKNFQILLVAVLLSGCASTIPPQIRQTPQAAPSLTELREHPAEHLDQRVRLGGRVAEVENRPDVSLISIVALPLRDSGRPRDSDRSAGRFVARVQGFVDPAVYQPGRMLTVSGFFRQLIDKKIGEFAYTHPLIDAEVIYLWPQPVTPASEPVYPWWPYDPRYPPYFYEDDWFYPYPYRSAYPRQGELICKLKNCSR